MLLASSLSLALSYRAGVVAFFACTGSRHSKAPKQSNTPTCKVQACPESKKSKLGSVLHGADWRLFEVDHPEPQGAHLDNGSGWWGLCHLHGHGEVGRQAGPPGALSIRCIINAILRQRSGCRASISSAGVTVPCDNLHLLQQSVNTGLSVAKKFACAQLLQRIQAHEGLPCGCVLTWEVRRLQDLDLALML